MKQAIYTSARKLFSVAVSLLGSLALIQSSAEEPWTLHKALEVARANNPEARLAQLRIKSAAALLIQANAAFWPKLQMESSYSRMDNPLRVFGAALNQHAVSPDLDFNEVPQGDNLNVAGVVSMPLYNGGRSVAERRAALARKNAAAHLATAVRQDVDFEVTRAFLTVLKARALVRAALAASEAFETNSAIAQRRFEAGTLLKTETLDVKVRLAEAQENLFRARNGEALARRALQTLAGLETGSIDISESAPELAPPAQRDFSARPELAQAFAEKNAAQSDLEKARGGYRPRVSAFARGDYDRGWEFNGSGTSWTAGVVLQWDLWDGFLSRGRVDQAEAEAKAAAERERKTRLDLALESDQARLKFAEAAERIRVTRQAVDFAAESASLTRVRFEQGLALSTQLIDSETALLSARVRQAEAEADAKIAIAALRKAAGLPIVEMTKQ